MSWEIIFILVFFFLSFYFGSVEQPIYVHGVIVLSYWIQSFIKRPTEIIWIGFFFFFFFCFRSNWKSKRISICSIDFPMLIVQGLTRGDTFMDLFLALFLHFDSFVENGFFICLNEYNKRKTHQNHMKRFFSFSFFLDYNSS